MLLTTVAASPTLVGKLSHLWAYVTIGATSIVTEEVAPVVGGFAAHQGHLHAVHVVMAVAIGTWSADIVLYMLGRWRLHRLAHRWPSLRRPMARMFGAVRRHPWRASLAVRYAYGARLLLPLTCGAAHVPPGRYVAGSGISAWSWSALFTGLGWAFGESAVALIGHVKRHEERIAIALGVVVLLTVLLLALRNRARVPEELDRPAFRLQGWRVPRPGFRRQGSGGRGTTAPGATQPPHHRGTSDTDGDTTPPAS